MKIVLTVLVVIISLSFSTAVRTTDEPHDVANPSMSTYEYAPDLPINTSLTMSMNENEHIPVQADFQI